MKRQPHPVMQHLARERITRGLSQRDAARMAGLARSTIGVWETGEAHPTLNALEDLLAAFDLMLQVVPRSEAARAEKATRDALDELIGVLAGLLLDEASEAEAREAA
jgi:HTH-type transcriptional regulator / antitoxin HipB